ncbi:MAG: LacI family DNA-binding transcriptional regulator [Bacteroidales bacterium]
MKEVTIYDVARELGLSASTVSRGLRDHPHIQKDTKKKILATASRMGYRHNKFASSLRQKKTSTLGVVVPRLNSYFMATVISGIEKVTNREGYNLIITQSQESSAKEGSGIDALFNSRVDGFLVSLSTDTRDLGNFRQVFRSGIPVVFFDRVMECAGCSSIVIDNHKAAYEAVKHLAEQGCTRIAHLGGNPGRNVYADRLRGYRSALGDVGLPYDEKLVFSSDLTSTSGEMIAKQILKQRRRPDGLFCANDTSAVAAIIAFREAGLSVPFDIAVAGFNNEPLSRVIQPELTTVNYPAHDIGEMAATTLINKLKNSETASPSTIVLEHKLIVRASSTRKS